MRISPGVLRGRHRHQRSFVQPNELVGKAQHTPTTKTTYDTMEGCDYGEEAGEGGLIVSGGHDGGRW